MDNIVINQSNLPLVSVLITSYNVSKFVRFSISSILNQTYQNFEVIFIDDGSEDNTGEIINSYNSSKILYFKVKHSGRTEALNYGLTLCKGDFVAIMDADDIALPTRLEKQINFMNLNPQIQVLSSYFGVFKNNHIEYIVKNPVNHESIAKFLLLHSCICHGGALIKKSVYREFAGYRETACRDYEFWLRIKEGVRFHNLPEVLMLVRYNPNSLTKKDVKKTNLQTYTLQNEYLNKALNDKSLTKSERSKLSGWREFFYGDKKKARNYFSEFLFRDIKITLAFFLSYSPDLIFEYIKEQRIRYRLEYILSENKMIKRSLRTFLTTITNISE
jgi:glycosyltransferase involved in cell wall biosynthesis